MTFSQLSLEYFFQKKADGKILSGSTFVFKRSQGFPLIQVVSAQTQTITEIAAHPSLRSPHFSLLHFIISISKPALLFSALWMKKHERKRKIMLLAQEDSQIQDTPGSSPDPSFSWWSLGQMTWPCCSTANTATQLGKTRSSLEATDRSWAEVSQEVKSL